jgi:hypothetical protein
MCSTKENSTQKSDLAKGLKLCNRVGGNVMPSSLKTEQRKL